MNLLIEYSNKNNDNKILDESFINDVLGIKYTFNKNFNIRSLNEIHKNQLIEKKIIEEYLLFEGWMEKTGNFLKKIARNKGVKWVNKAAFGATGGIHGLINSIHTLYVAFRYGKGTALNVFCNALSSSIEKPFKAIDTMFTGIKNIMKKIAKMFTKKFNDKKSEFFEKLKSLMEPILETCKKLLEFWSKIKEWWKNFKELKGWKLVLSMIAMSALTWYIWNNFKDLVIEKVDEISEIEEIIKKEKSGEEINIAGHNINQKIDTVAGDINPLHDKNLGDVGKNIVDTGDDLKSVTIDNITDDDEESIFQIVGQKSFSCLKTVSAAMIGFATGIGMEFLKKMAIESVAASLSGGLSTFFKVLASILGGAGIVAKAINPGITALNSVIENMDKSYKDNKDWDSAARVIQLMKDYKLKWEDVVAIQKIQKKSEQDYKSKSGHFMEVLDFDQAMEVYKKNKKENKKSAENSSYLRSYIGHIINEKKHFKVNI